MDPFQQHYLDPASVPLPLDDEATADQIFAGGYDYAIDGTRTPMLDDQVYWVHAHSAGPDLDYFHPTEPGAFPADVLAAPYADAFPTPFYFSDQPMNPPSNIPFAAQETTPNPYVPSISSSIASSPELVFHTPPMFALTPAAPTPATDFTARVRASSIVSATCVDAPSIPHAGPSMLHVPLQVPRQVPPSTPISTSKPTSTLESTSRSRSPSPLASIGTLSPQTNTWRCAFPGCTSKAHFARPCDLRKHFRRHSKVFFCRWNHCPQSLGGAQAVAKARPDVENDTARAEGSASVGREGVADVAVGTAGFGSKKDRARHEASHNPGVSCEWEGCERVFSRRDNMLDHARRIHGKGAAIE